MQDQLPRFFDDENVKGITLWGYVVGKTWKDGSGLLTETGEQRPAMTWLLDLLDR